MDAPNQILDRGREGGSTDGGSPTGNNLENHAHISSLLIDCSDDAEKVVVLLRRLALMEDSQKAAQERAAREKASLAQEISRKNQLIDRMRIKLHRYEFALKEAVLFLGKPMDAYEVWLTSSRPTDAANTAVVDAIQRVVAAANPAYSAANASFLVSPAANLAACSGATGAASFSGGLSAPASQAPTSPATPSLPAARSRAVSTVPPPQPIRTGGGGASVSSLAITTQHDYLPSPSPALLPPPPPPLLPPSSNNCSNSAGGATTLEIHCLECIRLSLNYLKNAQASILAIDKDAAASIDASLPPLLLASTGGSNAHNDCAVLPLTEALGSLKAAYDSGPESAPAVAVVTQPKTNTSTSGGSTAVAKSRALAYARLHSPERQLSAHVTNAALYRAATMAPIAAAVAAAGVDDADSGDIACSRSAAALLLPPASASNNNTGTNSSVTVAAVGIGGGGNGGGGGCAGCRELRLQIDQHRDCIDNLRADVTTLANQLADERAMRDRTQLAKDILDHELEELTTQLFDQANKMVADEARMRDSLESSNRELQGELRELVARCEGREEELRELSRNLRALEAAKLRSSVFSINGRGGSVSGGGAGTGSSLPGSLHSSFTALNSTSAAGGGGVSGSQSGSPTGMFPNRVTSSYYITTSLLPAGSKYLDGIPVDGILLSEFQDHIRQNLSAISSPTNPNPAPPAVGCETLFMKRCILEDVEPCLFSTYPVLLPGPGGTYSTAKLGKPVSGLAGIRKRLLDAFARGQIEIFAAPGAGGGSAQSLAATSPAAPSADKGGAGRQRCASCTLTRDCDFRLRLCDRVPADAGLPLCLFCRDRAAAVGDFFAFMRLLRHGASGPGRQGMTLLAMLRHALWLRRRMAAARVGNCAMFEPLLSVAAAERRGGDGEWEKLVIVVY